MRSPRGVVKTPARARLFLEVIVNSNIGLIITGEDGDLTIGIDYLIRELP